MNPGVIAAIISGGFSIVVALISLHGVKSSNKETTAEIQHKLETRQAVTDEKITELTREVREHNNFARRMPVVEEQIKVVNHRINDLEEFHKHQ